MRTNFIVKPVLFLILLLLPFTSVSKQLAENCELKVGWSPWPPYLKGETNPTGLQIELLNWISEETNCRLIYKKLVWKTSIEQIKSGEIDLIGRASKTPARQSFSLFSDTYRENIMVLYVRGGTKDQIKGRNLKEMLDSGFKLGVGRGAYYGSEVESLRNQKKYKNNFIEYNFGSSITFEPILNGSVDGVFDSPFAMDQETYKYGVTNEIEEFPIQIVTDNLHFMFSKKSVSSEFVKKFNLALSKVKQSKQYQSHWFWSNIN